MIIPGHTILRPRSGSRITGGSTNSLRLHFTTGRNDRWRLVRTRTSWLSQAAVGLRLWNHLSCRAALRLRLGTHLLPRKTGPFESRPQAGFRGGSNDALRGHLHLAIPGTRDARADARISGRPAGGATGTTIRSIRALGNFQVAAEVQVDVVRAGRLPTRSDDRQLVAFQRRNQLWRDHNQQLDFIDAFANATKRRANPGKICQPGDTPIRGIRPLLHESGQNQRLTCAKLHSRINASATETGNAVDGQTVIHFRDLRPDLELDVPIAQHDWHKVDRGAKLAKLNRVTL